MTKLEKDLGYKCMDEVFLIELSKIFYCKTSYYLLPQGHISLSQQVLSYS